MTKELALTSTAVLVFVESSLEPLSPSEETKLRSSSGWYDAKGTIPRKWDYTNSTGSLPCSRLPCTPVRNSQRSVRISAK
ncbi:hypothetical protein BJX76DRAFT_339149 [Aspergillus varians]